MSSLGILLSRSDSSTHYRPEIDGLRCIAVLLVVLFHLNLGCSGGYVGVDVFFVISGYLISSIILREHLRGTFSLAKFWSRRIRRIMPASIAMVFAVLVVGYLVLLPDDYSRLGQSAISHGAIAANLFFWRRTGYFAGDAEEHPLLHMWSLAVEEQFYVILPFVLLFCLRGSQPKKTAFWVSAVLGGLSLVISCVAVSRSPVAAFYLLPSRSWELMLGVLLSFLPQFKSHAIAREVASAVGLLLIGGSGLYFDLNTPFPGFYALFPCIGTALVLIANSRSESSALTVSGRLLSLQPLRFVGLASYSIYLWHWPIIVFYSYVSPVALETNGKLTLLATSLIMGFASWAAVEVPFRKAKPSGSARRTIVFGVALSASTIIAGYSIFRTDGFAKRFSSQVLQLANARSDVGFVYEGTKRDVIDGRLPEIGDVSKKKTTVLIWGDSHAMSMVPAFDQLFSELEMKAVVATHSSTAPVLGWFAKTKYGLDEKAVAFGNELLELVEKREIQDVVLTCFWTRYLVQDSSGFGEALQHTVQRLTSEGRRVWIVMDVPKQGIDVPVTLARAEASGFSVENYLAPVLGYTDLRNALPATIAAVEKLGVEVIDPKPLFQSTANDHYVVRLDEQVLYRDDEHLTPAGAKKILLPLFRQRFVALGGGQPSSFQTDEITR